MGESEDSHPFHLLWQSFKKGFVDMLLEHKRMELNIDIDGKSDGITRTVL